MTTTFGKPVPVIATREVITKLTDPNSPGLGWEISPETIAAIKEVEMQNKLAMIRFLGFNPARVFD